MRSLPAVVLFALLTMTCDPMASITFVNNTGEKLEFYTQSDVQTALLGTRYVDAGSSVEHSIMPRDFVTLRVAATREDGQWVFDHKYTRNEFERQGGKVTVSSLDPISPPSDVVVIPPQGGTPPVLPSPPVKPGSVSTQTPPKR